MKRIILITIILSVLISSINAQEISCPADRAAKQGYDPFGEFHHILAPVWHNSWPEKDYDALFAAGPKFSKLFQDIKKMKPVLKTELRQKKFEELRNQFGILIRQFAQACAGHDKETVYKLMPELHDAFEITASSLLPVHYPELQGIVITLNMILETHLPKDNMDGIVGSTETLLRKVSSLDEKTIPVELIPQTENILKEFEAIRKTADNMKECCNKEDIGKYKEHALVLSRLLSQFHNKFI